MNDHVIHIYVLSVVNIEQLKALVWVARLKGFAAAAAKLNTTQPAISSRIRGLEEELGRPLFERTTRSVRITPEGRKCLATAERIVDLMGEIKNEVGRANQASGAVIIGVSEVIAMTWLAELMAKLSQDYPLVQGDVDVGSTRNMFSKLRGGEVDLLLVGGIPEDMPLDGFVIESLGRLDFRWMAAKNYGPPVKRSTLLTAGDLQHYRIITYTRRSFLFYKIDKWFREGGAQMGRYIMCDSLPLIASLVISGQGIGLLPQVEARSRIHDSRMRILPTEPEGLSLDYHCVYPAASVSNIPKIIAELAKAASNFYPDGAADQSSS